MPIQIEPRICVAGNNLKDTSRLENNRNENDSTGHNENEKERVVFLLEIKLQYALGIVNISSLVAIEL